MPRLPKVFIRRGYAMIETGNGDSRHFDPEGDAWILPELAVKLPEENMDSLLAAIFDLPPDTPTIPETPTELLGTRLKLKNLASPDAVKAYVRALPGNWIVKDIGGGPWDFAVSKDGETWHLFDPGPLESFKYQAQMAAYNPITYGRVAIEPFVDLLDLTTDALIGTAAGTAFAAGAVGGSPTGPGAIAVGAGAAGATTVGLETLKQIIGEVAGIENNVDVPDAVALGVLTSVFSGAGPYAGRAIKKGGRLIARGTKSRFGQQTREAILEAAAGLSGIPGNAAMRPERVLEGRIKHRAKIFQKLPGVDKVSAALRRMVQRASAQQIPEQAVANEMEEAATAAGVTVNVKEMIDDILGPLTTKLDEKTGRRIFRTREGAVKSLSSSENVPSKAQALIDSVSDIIGIDGADTRAVPIETAVKIKQALQKLGADSRAIRGAVDAKESTTVFEGVTGEFSKRLRREIADSMDSAGIVDPASNRIYSQVMNDFRRKMDQLNRWKKFLGADQPEEKGRQTAAAFVKSLHGPTKGGFKEAADSLRASTGVDVLSMAETAMIAEAFGEQGVAKIFPRISAVGEPVGSGLGKKAIGVALSPMSIGGVGGGVVGGMVAGPPGVVGGAMLGGTMASEAGQLAIARHAAPFVKNAVVGGGRMAARGLEQTSKARSIAVMQSAARHLMATPDLTSSQAAKVSLEQGQAEIDRKLKAENARRIRAHK